MKHVDPKYISELIEGGVVFSEGCAASTFNLHGEYEFEFYAYSGVKNVSCEFANNIVLGISSASTLVGIGFIDIYSTEFMIKTYDHFLGETLLNIPIEYDTISEEMYFQLSLIHDMKWLTFKDMNNIFEIARNLRSRNKA